jgi:hypothetical protein
VYDVIENQKAETDDEEVYRPMNKKDIKFLMLLINPEYKGYIESLLFSFPFVFSLYVSLSFCNTKSLLQFSSCVPILISCIFW